MKKTITKRNVVSVSVCPRASVQSSVIASMVTCNNAGQSPPGPSVVVNLPHQHHFTSGRSEIPLIMRF